MLQFLFSLLVPAKYANFVQEIEFVACMEKEITFIINRSEITAGTRGASLGPDAIITAARVKNSVLFGSHEIFNLPQMNHLLDQPTPYLFAKRINGLKQVLEAVSEKVSSELKNNHFPIVLAGDHGSAAGTLAGIKNAYPEKRIGAIWIDAHGDLHTPFTTPSGNMHGMPLALAMAEDNMECAKNNVPAETVALWEELKNIGFPGAKILPQDLVFIGVRDTEAEEDALMERLSLRNFKVEEVLEKGTEQIAVLALDYLKECDLIYISFDVDSMDPKATSYGTGTPVRNGLIPKQARQLLISLSNSPKTVCVEFVEVNPCLDEKLNRMGEVAFELLESLVNSLKK